MGTGSSDAQIIYNLGVFSVYPIGHKDGLNIHHFSKRPVTFHVLIIYDLIKGRPSHLY